MLVVGAGPAGVALAMRLRRLGADVALVAAPIEAGHGFETLNAAAQSQLAFEGLAPEGGASFDFETRWGRGAFASRAAPGLLVERRGFHEALRRRATEAGVRVPAPGQVRARWRADATGRRGMARVAGRRRGPPLIGLHSLWAADELPRAIRVAAVEEAWVWGAPTPDGRYAISVFQDPRGSKRGGDPAARIAGVIAQSEILGDAANLRLTGAVVGRDATFSQMPAHDNLQLFRVGDAALALDPLSSSGVQTALQSAVDAALAIQTLSLDPGAGPLVADFLEQRSARRARRHEAFTASFYGEAAAVYATPFWADRAGPARSPPRVQAPDWDQPIALAPGVRIRVEPCPLEDRIALRRVVAPPGEEEPFAVVDAVEIAPLFDLVAPDATTDGVMRDWSARVGEARALRLLGWAWRLELLTSGRNQADERAAPFSAAAASREFGRNPV